MYDTSISIPLRQVDPAEQDGDGLNGSTIEGATILDESLHSLIVDSAEYPSTVLSPDWLRPRHQSVTGNGPSKIPNADFKAVFMSDCSKLITDEACTWGTKVML